MVSAKGVPLSRWLASKIMKDLNIVSCQQPEHRYKKATKEHVDIPNHLDRQFAVTEPNQTWCGDETYIWTGKRWAYLAVVLDLFSRKPKGWAMSFSQDSGLTGKALTMAWEARENRLTLSSVLLSSYIGTKWMYLSVAFSMSLKGCRGITKPIVLAALVKRSSLTIW